MWFVFDAVQDEFKIFGTAEEAEKEAEGVLDYYRDESMTDGWPEEVDLICWGRVTHIVEKFDVRPDESGRFSCICNYRFTTIVDRSFS